MHFSKSKSVVTFSVLLQVSKEELAKLVQGFDKQDILTSSGVTLAGNRYIYLSGTDRVIRAKLGKVGVHCMKTTQGECEGNTSENYFGAYAGQHTIWKIYARKVCQFSPTHTTIEC